MFRREGNILSNVLRDASDEKRVLRTLTKVSPVRATDAHISLIGHTTIQDLYCYLSYLDVANGTGNRLLLAAVDRARLIASPPRLPDATRDQLVTTVRSVITLARDVGHLRRTPESDAYWAEVYPHITADKPGLLGALLARGPAHVVRLSALFALLTQAPLIDGAHLASALAWWDYRVASAEIIFAGRTGTSDADRIKMEIPSSPAGQNGIEVTPPPPRGTARLHPRASCAPRC